MSEQGDKVRDAIIQDAKLRQLAESLAKGESPIFAAERKLARGVLRLLDEKEASA